MIPLFIVIVAILPLSLAETSQSATYLMCDPAERLVEIQVCDYSNSSYGGICFYSLRERPFRTNSTDLRSLSSATVISLPHDKERELQAFLGNRITSVEHRPTFQYGIVPVSQHVPPYQRFVVHQKMILCGPYAVPTPEVVIAATVPLSLSDTSDAATDLTCDPLERLVEVQVCDFSNSPYGGICPYALRERPFRTNSTDLRALSEVVVTGLSPDNERELLAFLGNRIAKVERRPALTYGMERISQFVPPYQRFTVRQKMILCGPYAVPTPEVVPTFDVPRIDRWMLHHASKRLFYLSSEKVTRPVAERRCKEMRGQLAMLDEWSEYNFVSSIYMLKEPLSVTADGVWTAATNYNSTNYLNLQWREGKPRYAITTFPLGVNGCVITLFQLHLFTSVGCTSSNIYVCEKDS